MMRQAMAERPLKSEPTPRIRRRLRWIGFAAVAVLGHAGLAWWAAQSQPHRPASALTPSLDVIVLPLFLPPPPPPPPERAEVRGGGRPSAPSAVRPSPAPTRPPEVAAPPQPAPEPPLVVGRAEDAAPTPDQGLGLQGRGAGTGAGDGSGPGRGAPPRLLQGPSLGQLRALHPPAALRAGRSGEATVACDIGLDQRLHGCRVIAARPAGQGFEAAALRAAETHYRFQPPVRDGVPVADQPVTITILFGRPAGR